MPRLLLFYYANRVPIWASTLALALILAWLVFVQSQQCPHGCIAPSPFCSIKGNFVNHEKIYHTRNDPYYTQTIVNPARGEFYFCTEEEARANGFRPALKP